MKLNLTWGELARAAGGRLTRGDASAPIDSVATDTRALKPGQAFWALVGERMDAHSLLTEAFAKASTGWIVANGKLPENAPRPAHVVQVPDRVRVREDGK